MQTQETYHAVKSFILDVTNGLTVIDVPYDYVLFVYATNKKYSPEHTYINFIYYISHTFIPPNHT